MQHADPICNRLVDDEAKFILTTPVRWFYFCSEKCMNKFTNDIDLYLEKTFSATRRIKYAQRWTITYKRNSGSEIETVEPEIEKLNDKTENVLSARNIDRIP